ncbi:MAG: Cupin 2 conserved barrel domain protein [Solirubrobacterales bacterium]|nr:Cupin 2 conserved barrel domain protein [Solirubrobacterales bacterium]
MPVAHVSLPGSQGSSKSYGVAESRAASPRGGCSGRLLDARRRNTVHGVAGADTIDVGPLQIRFLVENDALSMFECHVPPGGRVPAPHSHDAFEETIYGLSGTTFFTVGDERHALTHGQAVYVPRGLVHGFDVGNEGAVFLAVATPGVFGSAYFRELGRVIAASAGPPNPQDIMSVMRRHGLTPASPN